MIDADMEAKEIEIEWEQGKHKGEKWKGEIDICSHPVCSCSDVYFKFPGLPDVEGSDAPPVRSFGIEVFEKEAVEPEEGDDDGYFDADFAKSFVNDLTDDDWAALRKLFTSYKNRIAENAPLDDVVIRFPMKRIEKAGEMVGYQNVFRWAESLYIDVNGRKYLLDEQYCLATDCNCRDTALTFVPLGLGKRLDEEDSLTVRFDYKRKTWELVAPGRKVPDPPGALVKEVIRKRFPQKFRKHHERLRHLYSNFLKRRIMKKLAKKTARKAKRKGKGKPDVKSRNTPSPSTPPKGKIPRNAPCPCGSGRKYKKCCMNK